MTQFAKILAGFAAMVLSFTALADDVKKETVPKKEVPYQEAYYVARTAINSLLAGKPDEMQHLVPFKSVDSLISGYTATFLEEIAASTVQQVMEGEVVRIQKLGHAGYSISYYLMIEGKHSPEVVRIAMLKLDGAYKIISISEAKL